MFLYFLEEILQSEGSQQAVITFILINAWLIRPIVCVITTSTTEGMCRIHHLMQVGIILQLEQALFQLVFVAQCSVTCLITPEIHPNAFWFEPVDNTPWKLKIRGLDLFKKGSQMELYWYEKYASYEGTAVWLNRTVQFTVTSFVNLIIQENKITYQDILFFSFKSALWWTMIRALWCLSASATA